MQTRIDISGFVVAVVVVFPAECIKNLPEPDVSKQIIRNKKKKKKRFLNTKNLLKKHIFPIDIFKNMLGNYYFTHEVIPELCIFFSLL